MILADSSVAIAAFAAWHEFHQPAHAALSRAVRLVAHCAVETYSVLTRLPAPHRARPEIVLRFLQERFDSEYVVLDHKGHRLVVERCTSLGISGGAVYDALVALTALGAGATLISCDVRAAAVYEKIGVDFQLIS